MADYSEAKHRHDILVAQERSEKEMTTVQNPITGDMETNRRITNGSHFQTGGYIVPATPPGPKVKHMASFESAGEQFTVAELRAALNKLQVSADATIDFELMDYDGERNDAVLATVEWTT